MVLKDWLLCLKGTHTHIPLCSSADGYDGSVKHLDIIGSETDLSPANFEEEIDKIILRRCRHLAQPQAPS